MTAPWPDPVRMSLSRRLAAWLGSGLPLTGVAPVSPGQMPAGAPVRKTAPAFPRLLEHPNPGS
jgi:hypothetical protein